MTSPLALVRPSFTAEDFDTDDLAPARRRDRTLPRAARRGSRGHRDRWFIADSARCNR
ncbi:hypothetical protein AB0395_22245 [Streptosporangium sp. NPDC051023]|uniref:hypothetical protein n=1 Tax=Streptosporangium sp. NPDC051023 TaxID=3155410 RepID=UPI00344CA31F